MTAPLLAVTGTGTGIGKTHTACAVALAWSRRLAAGPGLAALKPVESGVPPNGEPEDGARLAGVSTFHVKHRQAPYLLARPVSPHLAARDAGVAVDLEVVARWVRPYRERAAGVLVELPGGLFSPVAPGKSNADLAKALAPTATLLVAPDRLGVLHDVGATARAARAADLALHGIVLVAPAEPDASTGTNAAEMPEVTDVPVLAVLPRGTCEDLALRGDLERLVASLGR